MAEACGEPQHLPRSARLLGPSRLSLSNAVQTQLLQPPCIRREPHRTGASLVLHMTTAFLWVGFLTDSASVLLITILFSQTRTASNNALESFVRWLVVCHLICEADLEVTDIDQSDDDRLTLTAGVGYAANGFLIGCDGIIQMVMRHDIEASMPPHR